MSIAVAFLYGSRNTWYKDFPHVVAGSEATQNHVKVYSQRELPYAWSTDHNHDYDPASLQLIRIANSTLVFDWLFVSDGDTCVDVRRLNHSLSKMNHTAPYFLGHPMSPSWKCCCSDDCCELNAHHKPCIPTKVTRGFFTEYYSRPHIWPFGGAGYVLSKVLLNMITEQQWKDCERKLLRNGGDVRVASCILSHTGIALTHWPRLLKVISHHRVYACNPASRTSAWWHYVGWVLSLIHI